MENCGRCFYPVRWCGCENPKLYTITTEKTLLVSRYWGKEPTLCISECTLPEDHSGCCFR